MIIRYYIFLLSLSAISGTCPSLKGELSNCHLVDNTNYIVEMIWNRFTIETQKISENQDLNGNIISYSNQENTFTVNKNLKTKTDIGELLLAPIKCNSGYVQTKTISSFKPLSFEVEAEISVSASENQYSFYIRNTYSDFRVNCQRKN